MELYQAHRQWATRPNDERFGDLKSMYDACYAYYQNSRSSTFTLGASQIVASRDNEDVLLQGKTGVQAKLTHHAFSQLATTVGAPANYLRSLPTDLVSQNLNHGMQKQEIANKPLKGLFHSNGSLVCRCMLSTQYQRIWNHEIVQRLIPLNEDGWNVPPAITDNEIASGLYASDHDMFAFLIDDKHRINDGTDDGLGRGFFAINSEVGQSAFKLITFYYRFVCGNHIVWGAQNVQQVRIIHKGQPARDWQQRLRVELTKYANSSASDDEAKIERAKTLELGSSKEEVLDFLFGKRSLGITRKDLNAAYALAEVDSQLTDGSNPNSAWGMVQGITRHSQSLPYADERTKLDIAAGKILEMAF